MLEQRPAYLYFRLLLMRNEIIDKCLCEMGFYMFDGMNRLSSQRNHCLLPKGKTDFRKDKFSPIKADVYPQIVSVPRRVDLQNYIQSFHHHAASTTDQEVEKSQS